LNCCTNGTRRRGWRRQAGGPEDGGETGYRPLVFQPRMARKTRIFVGLVGFVVAKGLFNRGILPARRDAETLRKTVEPRRARETEDGGGDWNHERSPNAFPIFHHSTIPVFLTSDARPALAGYRLPNTGLPPGFPRPGTGYGGPERPWGCCPQAPAFSSLGPRHCHAVACQSSSCRNPKSRS
jgi:hypothetical protein